MVGTSTCGLHVATDCTEIMIVTRPLPRSLLPDLSEVTHVHGHNLLRIAIAVPNLEFWQLEGIAWNVETLLKLKRLRWLGHMA